MAAISLLGTLAGSGGSIIMANKLISYRIERLEETVKERHSAIERLYRLELDNMTTKKRVNEIVARLDAGEKKTH